MSRLAGLFRASLQKHPILTNTAVYFTFYSAAETSQQTYNKYFTAEKPEYDFATGARIACVGSSIYAPTLYYWYRFLDRKFVGTAVKTIGKKVVCEQFFMTPILLAVFYGLIAVLEQKEDLFKEFREKYLITLAANQVFWIPAQTVNFSFIPSHLRVVYVASASFIWINILCFIKRGKVASNDDEKDQKKKGN